MSAAFPQAITAELSAAAQFMIAMNQQQNALALEDIFVPANLTAREGRAASVEKIMQLDDLLAAYRGFHEQYLVKLNATLLESYAELTGSQRDDAVATAAERLQAHLDDQARFLALRKRWIDSVRAMLGILDAAGEGVHFDGEHLLFADDDALTAFAEAMAAVDECSQQETELSRRRLERFVLAGAALGLRTD